MAQRGDSVKEDLKGWAVLKRYGHLRKKLEYKEGRLEEFRESMLGLGAVNYDGMPRGSSNGTSRQERLAIRLESMEEELAVIAEQEAAAYEELTALLSQLQPTEELLLTMRYMDGKRWNTINCTLFGDEYDFDEREDKYLKRTFKKHSSALHNLEKLLEAKDLGSEQQ